MHSSLPRGVRPRLEGKPRTPLSSRVATRVTWSPLSGLKGVQPPLPFGERTRDCSRVTSGQMRPHLCLCLGPNVPLQGRQGSRVQIRLYLVQILAYNYFYRRLHLHSVYHQLYLLQFENHFFYMSLIVFDTFFQIL